MTHFEFEDTDIMRLLLQYDGDKNIQTKLVRSRIVQLFEQFRKYISFAEAELHIILLVSI